MVVAEAERTLREPFELRLSYGPEQPHRVFTTSDYDFARAVALRRLTDTGCEAKGQPHYACVKHGDEVLMEARRLDDADGNLKRIVIDRDWHYEDSPFRPVRSNPQA